MQQPTGDIPRIPIDDVAPTGPGRNGFPDSDFHAPVNGNGDHLDAAAMDPGAYAPDAFDTGVVDPGPLNQAGDSHIGSVSPEGVAPSVDGVFAQSRAENGNQERSLRSGAAPGRPVPSALPEFDDPPAEAEQPGFPQAGTQPPPLRTDPSTGNYAAVGAAAMTGETYGAMSGNDPYEMPHQSPALTSPGRARQPQSPPINATRQMDQPMGGGFGDPGAPAPGRRPGGGRPRGGDRRDRPQDTEFKLADKRPRQKPKEPNRFLLAAGLAAILLLGAAAAWYFTRDTTADEVATGDTEQAVTESTDTTEPATPEATVAPEPLVNEPTLFFDAATAGPLQQGETYSIDLVGEPDGSLLQVVVDDIPQGEPDVLLPDLILPAGRHTIYIQITNGAEVSQSTPIELYVLGDPPPQGFRANLSSVDMQTEGWAEAIRQFDEYRAAGHEALQIRPISPGYYNLFIGGLGEDRSAAVAYCESFSLAVPDQCFPTYFEPTEADAAATTGSTDESTDAMTDEDPDAMADEDTTSTTVAGG
ncbi:MAG: hypothetical protein AAGA65_25900 [Actinomycetota bacterium]